MKVAVVELMPFPDTIGGGTTHILNLSKALILHGHEVHVISSKAADKERNWNMSEIPKGIHMHNIGLRHKKFTGGNYLYYIYRLFFELTFILFTSILIRRLKPDIVDCQSPITPAFAAALSNYPFVITCHGIHDKNFGKLHKSKGNLLAGGFGNYIYTLMAKYASRKASNIFSQGDITIKYYEDLAGSKKGILLPNLIDTSYWHPIAKKNDKLIVTAARFTKQKGLDKLLIAMQSLKNLKLRLIGNGEMEEEMKKLKGKNVEFLGFQPPAVCLKEYQKARFTILPSEFEGLPYAILESMGAGVIPITTKVGDLKELIQDGKNGFFMKTNKPEDIIEAVKRALKCNYNKVSTEARKTVVDRWGLENVGIQFVQAYQKALK